MQLSVKIQKGQITAQRYQRRQKGTKVVKEKIKYAEESYASKQDTFFSSFPNGHFQN